MFGCPLTSYLDKAGQHQELEVAWDLLYNMINMISPINRSAETIVTRTRFVV